MNTREDPRRSSYFQPTKESVEAGEPKYVGYTIGAKANAVASNIPFGEHVSSRTGWVFSLYACR